MAGFFCFETCCGADGIGIASQSFDPLFTIQLFSKFIISLLRNKICIKKLSNG